MNNANRLARAAFILAAGLPAMGWAGEAIDRIVRRDQINVGYRTDAPPFSFLDANKAPIGYSIDLCRGIVERIKLEAGKPNLRVKYIPVDADQLARVVSSGGVDLMCAGTSDTEARRVTMAFSPVIYLSAVKFMVRAKDNVASARQLDQKTVAVIGRTTAENAVNTYGAEQGIKVKVSRAVGPDAALSQLTLGQANAYSRDEVLLVNQRAQAPRPLDYTVLPESASIERIAIALPRGDPLLQKAVDQGLALQVRGGQAAASYERWFMKPHAGAKAGLSLPMSAALKAELDKLR
jgi:glutamate/aspartate transport system substrate-binding protein